MKAMPLLDTPIRILLVIALGAALFWGGEITRRDLWEPDEARFALVAQEMREGHWLVPFRQGEYYAHKPPLMFWLTNLFAFATGGDIATVAPRLPSLLGAILALWSAQRLATRWFSPRAGWLTALLLATSVLFWNKAGMGQIDMLLCGLQLLALYGLFTTDRPDARGRPAAAYALMGLAVLAKGPVGFLIPWGLYWTTTLAAKKVPRPLRLHLGWGPLLTLAFPATWLLAAWGNGAPEGYFSELLWRQNIGRVTGDFGGHLKPFYYYMLYLPIDFLPWSLLAPLTVHVLRRTPERIDASRRLAAWIAFVVLFFSFSAGKRNLYILLAYPAAAMAVAAAVDQWARADPRWLRISFGAAMGAMLVMGVAMLAAAPLPMLPFDGHTLIPGGLALLIGAGWAWRSWRRAPTRPGWLTAMAIAMLALLASVGGLVYPAFDDLKTPDEIVAVTQQTLEPTERILMYRMHGEIYSLYTGRRGYMAMSDTDAIAFLHSRGQTNHLIIALDRHLPAIQAWAPATGEVIPFRSGQKKLVAIPIPSSPGNARINRPKDAEGG